MLPLKKVTFLFLFLIFSTNIKANSPPAQQHTKEYWQWVKHMEENHLAIIAEILPKYQQAQKEKDVLNPKLIYILAVAHYYADDYKTSARTVKPLLDISGFKRKARYLIALNLMQLNKGKDDWSIDALEYLRRCLRRNHDDPRVWMALQAEMLTAPLPGRNEFVDSFIVKIRRDHPNHFGPTMLRGTKFQILFQYSKAERELLKAYKLAPKNPAALNALVLHYRIRGDVAKSIQYLQELAALDFDPRFKEELEKDKAALKRIIAYAQNPPKFSPPEDKEDSEPVYKLPFPAGTVYYLSDPTKYSPHPVGQAHKDRGQYAFDFFTTPATPVAAARGGVIIKRHQNGERTGSWEFINHVIIDHGDGTFGRYYNLRNQSITKQKGETVAQGEIIAQTARNRITQSSHLHFDVVEKASGSSKQAHIYYNRETVPIVFEEFKALPESQHFNAWHISLNQYIYVEPE